MALIACPDCGKEVSSNAAACNGCGAPIAAAIVGERGDMVPYSAQEVAVMLSKKKSTNHILHLLLCIPTLGFWVVIWLLVALSNSMENARIDKMINRGKKLRW